MPSPISHRVQKLQPSATLSLAARARELRDAGQDVLSFGLGEPDFNTPEPIRAAAHDAIDAGHTHYTANEGILPLRQAIAADLQSDQELVYDPVGQIVVTAGAKQAIANAVIALVDDGDEVLLPAPYWLTYPEVVSLAGGTSRIVPTRAEDGFHLTAAELEKSVTGRSKLLILNSPNNPTGAVLSRAELEAIADVVLRHDLYVVSDEIYGPLVFGDATHTSIAAVRDGMMDRTIICHGTSKAYAMTGWRIGYAVGPKPIIGAMRRIQSHTTSNACSIAQHAALRAISECRGEIEPMRREFESRRSLVLERMSRIEGLELRAPEGAFYVFPKVSSYFGRKTRGGTLLTDSSSFCEALLSEALVSTVPGLVFGADDCFRLSYAASVETIETGLERLADFLGGIA